MELKPLIELISVKADWFALRYIEEKITYHSVRNEKLEQAAVSLDKGIMVEVLVDGQLAYACTNKLDSKSIQNTASYAVELAIKAQKYKLFNFTDKIRPQNIGNFASNCKQNIDQSAITKICDVLMNCSSAMQISDKIINNTAMCMVIERISNFASSNGSDIKQNFFSTAFSLSATAKSGTEIQTRSTGMPCQQIGLEMLDKEKLLSEAKKTAEEALELLDAEECPTGIYDLILMPSQLYLQVHESIGHPLEIDRILGDERNYAGWSFIKKEDFGDLKYGSELLNVTFDPNLEGEYASYEFDDIGHKATKEYLIKDGKLLRGLGSLESQVRSNVSGVANARTCSWNRAPIDRMANINIEPGSSTLEEMIKSVEKGIIMSTNRSWSIDDYRNKFQFGCEYAKLIENGVVTKTLKNPNYRGITTPFWNNLKMVGNTTSFEKWGSPYCGKGEPNQVIRVGHAIPICLFTSTEVFGGV